ncbi:hypothetical protein JKA74_12385 [Marivirga sp. S37H4]|uniref:Carboxypeptidase-like regulatory domain-containing protein n=2 Tax=Marivirga aurantiaca TaxID=2802615 RepID=A0A934WZ27_9BACT|nr:hypothetical protein [Marivirga aurantiaca]
MKKLLLLSFIIFMASMANGQSIKGTLYSSQDSLAIEGAHIINTTKSKMATSSAAGVFILEALPGDTMVISNINFNTRQFIVPEKKEVTIWLNPAEIQLKEVIVNNIPKSEADFRKKLIDMPMQDNGNFLPFGVTPGKPMGKIPVNYDRNVTNSVGYAINKPVSFIQKKLSKKYKAKRKYYETVASQGNTILAHKKFNRELVNSITGLEEEKLTKFIDFMDLDNSFIMNSSDYEIAARIISEFKSYQDQQMSDSVEKG